MKAALFFLLTLLATNLLQAQTISAFEGTIDYKVIRSYTDPRQQESYGKRDLVLGTTEKVQFKGQNAAEFTNGLTDNRRLYQHAERRMYLYFPQRPQVLWYNMSLDKAPLLHRQVFSAADTVLGIVCDVVEIQTADYTLRASVHPQFSGVAFRPTTPDTLLLRALSYPTAETVVLRRVNRQKNGNTTEQLATQLQPAAITDESVFVAPDRSLLLPAYAMLDNTNYQKEITQFSKFLLRNIRYPKAALKAGVAGTVVLEFLVQEDRTITDIQVLQSVEPSCDAEAVRVLSQFAKWPPRTYHGQPVKSVYVVPISFRPQ